MNALSSSPYSIHFRNLALIGAWVLDTNNTILIKVFVVYRTVVTGFGIYGAIALMLDFYAVFGNFRKMTWNLCVSLFYCGSLLKTFQLTRKIIHINDLRRELHESELSRKEPEDVIVRNAALREWKILRTYFYGAFALFVPAWLVTMYFSYLWGPRMLPVPMQLPIHINIEDELEYNFAFALLGTCGIIGILLVTEQEMAMFSIFIQIIREYRFLLNDISKLNVMYEEDSENKSEEHKDEKKIEFNPWLRKEKTKTIVKELSIKQQKLIKYTEEFEFCYSESMLFQLFGVSLLVTLNALQLLLESDGLNGNIFFQMGFLAVTTVDLFLICWFSTRISNQCFEVGEAAYATFWYAMSSDIQKDIGMIVMRSQHPPKITCGKLMELNLNVFMHRVSNIYSWLALFRQVEIKFNDQ